MNGISDPLEMCKNIDMNGISDPLEMCKNIISA